MRKTSPGSSAANQDSRASSSAIDQIMSALVSSWRSTPSTKVRTPMAVGSATSAAASTEPPIGVQPGKLLASAGVPVCTITSRAVRSLAAVTPATAAQASRSSAR